MTDEERKNVMGRLRQRAKEAHNRQSGSGDKVFGLMVQNFDHNDTESI